MTLIPDILREQAAAHPDRVAVVVDGVNEMTYGQWESRSNRLARHLVSEGYAAGDRVGLRFDNYAGLAYLIGYMGIHKAGLVAVLRPARMDHRTARRRHGVSRSDCPRAG